MVVSFLLPWHILLQVYMNNIRTLISVMGCLFTPIGLLHEDKGTLDTLTIAGCRADLSDCRRIVYIAFSLFLSNQQTLRTLRMVLLLGIYTRRIQLTTISCDLWDVVSLTPLIPFGLLRTAGQVAFLHGFMAKPSNFTLPWNVSFLVTSKRIETFSPLCY